MKKIYKTRESEKPFYQSKKGTIYPIIAGASTAVPSNVTYRLGKIDALGLLKGEWLDCGCADGGYTVAMANLGVKSIIGVDVLEERLVQARKRAENYPAVHFLNAASENLPFAEASFDGILLNEVLEHVADERQTLREIYRVLRPGGHLIVMSPNRWFPFEGHTTHVGQHYFEFPMPLIPWLPRAISRQFVLARNYWPHELRDMIHNEGFIVQAVEFVWPVLEVFPWLPHPMIRPYRNLIPVFDSLPFIRRFGVSIFVVAQK